MNELTSAAHILQHPTLDDLEEMDQGLHRSLAVALPSMPEAQMREALQCLTFCVPSRTQRQADAVTSSRMQNIANIEPPVSSDVRPSRFMAQPPTQQQNSENAATFESPLRPGAYVCCLRVCLCVCV